MEYISLGKTNLLVSRTSFGAMSLDCKEIEDFGEEAEEKACALVYQAYKEGINFFDLSHTKENCEKRLGRIVHGIRQSVVLATKSTAQSVQELRRDLQESLLNLDTDSIELYQLENPLFLPGPDTPDGLYNELLSMKERGLVRHIGLATENIEIAREAVESGNYEVVQFPFNVLYPQEYVDLVKLCAEKEIGCIAMQPMNGGLLSNLPIALGYLSQFENVVPVWGVHTQEELQQILYFTANPPVIDDQFNKEVEKIRLFFN
jgi:aryl-alcohol dehydrogenase-like predicted oxidoreductase